MPTDTVDLSSFFHRAEGSFIVYNPATNRRWVYNPERATRRFIPASTFKIPNALITLETGVADGEGFTLLWDSTKTPRTTFFPASWAKSQTLRSAIQYSVVWYFQEIARRIGFERMSAYIERFEYGNKNIEGGIDQFWLRGDLRISGYEQVVFLQRFYEGQLGLSDHSTETVKAIIVLDETPEYRLSGKTGTANVTETRELGWLVGYLERGDDVYYYALNMEGEYVFEDWPPAKRKELVLSMLKEIVQ